MSSSAVGDLRDFESWCPLADPDPMKASCDNLRLSKDVTLDVSLKKQIKRVRGCKKSNRKLLDDNGDVDVNPRWRTFDGFHNTLKDVFPFVDSHVKLEKANRYSPVYTFQGVISGS